MPHDIDAYLTGLMNADGGLYGGNGHYKIDFVADPSLEFCKTIKELVKRTFSIEETRI